MIGIRFNTNTDYWDDGNDIDSDGCSSTCDVESGYLWLGGDNNSPDIWERCGDGVRTSSSSSYWDDGNILSGDGCSSTWFIETGYSWNGGSSTTKDTCSEIWGDGKRYNLNSTYWDDGNTNEGDGWSSLWSIESNWKCSGGNSINKDTWNQIVDEGMFII